MAKIISGPQVRGTPAQAGQGLSRYAMVILYRVPRGNIYSLHFPHDRPWPVSASGLAWLTGSLQFLFQPPMNLSPPQKDLPSLKTRVPRVHSTHEPQAVAQSLPSVSRPSEGSKAFLPRGPLSTRVGGRALPGRM